MLYTQAVENALHKPRHYCLRSSENDGAQDHAKTT